MCFEEGEIINIIKLSSVNNMVGEIEPYSIGPKIGGYCKAMCLLFLCGLFFGSEKSKK